MFRQPHTTVVVTVNETKHMASSPHSEFWANTHCYYNNSSVKVTNTGPVSSLQLDWQVLAAQ